MTQATNPLVEMRSDNPSMGRSFSFISDELGSALTPWEVAFPDRQPLGYWVIFSKRCEKIATNSEGLVDEETAKQVWLSILQEYEDYQKMGMWLPAETLEEHRMVAESLGWIQKGYSWK